MHRTTKNASTLIRFCACFHDRDNLPITEMWSPSWERGAGHGNCGLRHRSLRLAKTLRSRGHKALLAVLVASRREARLTQRQLAERLKLPPSVIGKIETGERRLDVVEFTTIARALKVDPLTLYERFLAWERAGHGRGKEE